MARQSLFIASLPRSLSTQVYKVTRDAVGLAGPRWALNGELLNHDLLAFSRWPKLLPSSHKYLTEATAPERMEMLREYLDDVTKPEGRIYKDVVQPFVLASWPGLSRFAILKIRRDLAEVAHSMAQQGWHYPNNALSPADPLRRSLGMRTANHHAWSNLAQRAMRERWHGRLTARLCLAAILKGLLLAERELERMPGTWVDYEDLVRDESALRRALESMYPDINLAGLRYVDDAFVARRRSVSTALLPTRRRALAARIEQLRREL